MKKLLAAMFVALLMVGCGVFHIEGADPGRVAVRDENGTLVRDKNNRIVYRPRRRGEPEVFSEEDLMNIRNSDRNATPVSKAVTTSNLGGYYSLDDPKVQDKIIAIAATKIDQRKKFDGTYLSYLPRKQTPYTGWSVVFYDNGQIKHVGQLKDGKRYDLETNWHENGHKRSEVNYKDGKLLTVVVWKPNGEKCPVTNVVDGNGVVVFYNDDGTEDYRWTFKDGKLVKD